MENGIMTSDTLKSTITEKVVSIVERSDVQLSELLEFDKLVSEVGDAYRSNLLSKNDLELLARCFGDDFLRNTMQGYGLLKPYGYAGDFLMIDKIYTEWKSENPKFFVWDKYFHNHAAPKAVRNRKTYFKSVFLDFYNQEKRPVSLLNIASGPARDLLELYDLLKDQPYPVLSTCIDIDQDAINYAQKLLKPYDSHIEFVCKNLFHFSSNKKYDIVWSAGLFDYFNDRVFKLGLAKMKKWVKPGGQIIIGNFNKEYNPSRDYMEIFGEWYLNHRSKEQLIDLAVEAGFEKQNIYVGAEEENVNLFLHIKMPD